MNYISIFRYTFRARKAKSRWGEYFIGFLPAVSNEAAISMRREIRKWELHLWSSRSLEDLAGMFNPILRGWINYYSRFYKSALYPVFRHLNRILVRWVMRKYKKLKRRQRRATYWLGDIAKRDSGIFAHWKFGVRP